MYVYVYIKICIYIYIWSYKRNRGFPIGIVRAFSGENPILIFERMVQGTNFGIASSRVLDFGFGFSICRVFRVLWMSRVQTLKV